jgi:predicted nucleic acid-binding protein
MAAAMQALTQEWWEEARSRYNLRVSVLVLEEASRGDQEAAARRLDATSDLPVLALNEQAERLANLLLEEGLIPRNSVEDAFHIAMAAAHGLDYLVTWNFRHINNAESAGYACPTICSPEELGGIG